MSIRKEKIASQFKQELGIIICQELSDPRLGFTTITRVEPSPDLQSAKVYFSVLGTDVNIKMTENVLNRGARHLARRLLKKVRMKSAPELRFEYDDGIARSIEISQKLREVNDQKTDDLPVDPDTDVQ